MRISPLPAVAVMCLSLLASNSPIQAADTFDIGAIRSGERKVYTIAVPAFVPMEGSTPASVALNELIYNDLTLSGYFRPAPDMKAVEQLAAADRQRGAIQPTSWKGREIDLLVDGEFKIAGDTLQSTCKLYSIADNQRIMGKLYQGYTAKDLRQLAHKIADDIMFAITSIRGVAGTKVVFVSQRGQDKEVFCIDADGANLTQMTHDNSLNVTPTWGANATEIYYTSYKDYNPDLCGVFLRGTQSWFISRRPGCNNSPDWNKNNNTIVLTLCKDGNSEIYTMDRLGKSAKRLTTDKAIDSSPVWSPDGSRIAFTSSRGTASLPQLYIMSASGGSPTRLTLRGDYNDSAAWSPLGNQIAYTSRNSNGKFDIYTINLDGTNDRKLTSGANNEDPTWSPNGERLAFSSDRTGVYQIYTMNADGSNVQQLTTQGKNVSPDWSPFFDAAE